MANMRLHLKSLIVKLREKNAGAITVSALANAADISRSTIYKYYPDVLVLLRDQQKVATSDSSKDLRKLDMTKQQLCKSKELVSYLSNICSNQLIEISELEEAIEQLQKSSIARISYLESKIAKLEKITLRSVK